MRGAPVLAGILACLLAGEAEADSVTISYSDFSSVAGLTLNGSASQSGSVLRLTPDSTSQAGSAFLSVPIAFGGGDFFLSSFAYRIHGIYGSGPMGSDGFAFLIQADARGATALGTSGGELGYGNSPGGGARITPSMAVEFDTHVNGLDPGDNEVALHTGGFPGNAPLAYGIPAFALNNGNVQYVWVDYFGATDRLEVFVSAAPVKPVTPLFTYTLDLSTVVGTNLYFGFTAGTGGGTNIHDIVSWDLAVNPVPEPGTLALLTLAAAGVLARRRRRDSAAK